MTQDDLTLLAANSWLVECLSPLEIRHSETGSFATLLAAEMVVEALRRPQRRSMANITAELAEVNAQVQRLVQSTWDDWNTPYSLVFSGRLSRRAAELLAGLNLELEWLDPDADYEADVRAYAEALATMTQKLDSALPAGRPEDWQLMPKEPTETIRAAMAAARCSYDDQSCESLMKAQYRAAIAAVAAG